MSKGVTAKQLRVYEHIFVHTMEHGYQPSFQEVAAHFGWGNRTATQCHVKALRHWGYIGSTTNESRALRLLRTPSGEPFEGFVVRGKGSFTKDGSDHGKEEV
jgi:SOS-response transcriptional repressor LexA